MRYPVNLFLLVCAIFCFTGCRSGRGADAWLQEQQWHIASYWDGLALRFPSAQSSAVISFQQDMTISGSPGCGEFLGSYGLSGYDIAIRASDVVESGCQPEDITQNSKIISALSSVSRMELQNDKVLLKDSFGNPQIILTQ